MFRYNITNIPEILVIMEKKEMQGNKVISRFDKEVILLHG